MYLCASTTVRRSPVGRSTVDTIPRCRSFHRTIYRALDVLTAGGYHERRARGAARRTVPQSMIEKSHSQKKKPRYATQNRRRCIHASGVSLRSILDGRTTGRLTTVFFWKTLAQAAERNVVEFGSTFLKRSASK